MVTHVIDAIKCFHCGDTCQEVIHFEEKSFCCEGCKTVFEILNANNLCEYYKLDDHSGVSQKNSHNTTFDYLDRTDVSAKLLSFDSLKLSKVTFQVPAIHCVSCIWLLEHLQRLSPGILRGEVIFGRKTLTIDFDPTQIRLSQVASLLASVGYTPVIELDEEKRRSKVFVSDKALLYKLAVAGFCFGNIMLFSFPEYLGLDNSDELLKTVFSYLNLLLAIPVIVYSASSYFTSASRSFKQKQINIDVPIAAGLLALFCRSAYDILTQTGPGYLDSFSGLVFFLLIGRWFQGMTYESLSFERDFKSYFPMAVTLVKDNSSELVLINELKCDDIIRVRSMEIVPADAVLNDARAFIDYSFVTGESRPVKVFKGDLVYAGGRLIGLPVTLTVSKKISQSHLTNLWNNSAFRKNNESMYQKIIDTAARRFTWIVIAVAIITSVFWYFYSPQQMWLVITSVLMVACPCALALAAPFTYGSMLRVFGRNDFYLKNADVIERLASIDSIVFDKTGTITHGGKPQVEFVGHLSEDELSCVKKVASASTHPLSSTISKSIRFQTDGKLDSFQEVPGKGIEASIGNYQIKLGSADFVGCKQYAIPDATYVHLLLNNEYRGYFSIRIRVRSKLKNMVEHLGSKCRALLSGDGHADKNAMTSIFHPSVDLLFNQSPADKQYYISKLQDEGNKVMMIGDGLNDTGALKQSDVGIAVSDDSSVFTPACDGIIKGERLYQLDKFLILARYSTTILKVAFCISFFYNIIALGFAVTGHLTPLVAAILMPVSSISVVGFSTLAVDFIAKRKLNS